MMPSLVRSRVPVQSNRVDVLAGILPTKESRVGAKLSMSPWSAVMFTARFLRLTIRLRIFSSLVTTPSQSVSTSTSKSLRKAKYDRPPICSPMKAEVLSMADKRPMPTRWPAPNKPPSIPALLSRIICLNLAWLLNSGSSSMSLIMSMRSSNWLAVPLPRTTSLAQVSPRAFSTGDVIMDFEMPPTLRLMRWDRDTKSSFFVPNSDKQRTKSDR
mmetsp:Transcript_128063/g.221275  ORF Transcript_128063/g.221275 Transcript_128063/m.221275 type:complete len:214 (+) Transcript_128063:989-1630(+)